MAYCAYCKSRVFDEHAKCPNCGSTVFITDQQPIVQPVCEPEPRVEYHTIRETVYVQPAKSQRNRWIALLLCLLGGMMGLHRFYAGKIATGVLYLLTGGLLGFGVVVDFLVILCGSFHDKQGLPLAS